MTGSVDEGVPRVHSTKPWGSSWKQKVGNNLYTSSTLSHEKVQMLAEYLVPALWKQQWEVTRSTIHHHANTLFYELFIFASYLKGKFLFTWQLINHRGADTGRGNCRRAHLKMSHTTMFPQRISISCHILDLYFCTKVKQSSLD